MGFASGVRLGIQKLGRDEDEDSVEVEAELDEARELMEPFGDGDSLI